jgi:5-methylthioadenosine/S-adenosylhomocysteine deaminase
MRLITADLGFIDDAWIGGAAVVVDGDTITAAGDEGHLRTTHPGIRVEHWSDAAIVPGNVNGHGHTFQALLRGFGDDLRFGEWMGQLVHPTAAQLTADGIRVGAEYDFAEMLRMGITTAVEFFYLHDEGNDNSRIILDAGRRVGLRTVLARCMFDADPGPIRYRESPSRFETNFRELRAETGDDPMVAVHPAPHSVLGASAEMLELGAALAREYDTPLHVHVADSKGEVEVSRDRYGVTPVARLAEVGALDERTLAVHAVHIDAHDVDLLQASGATVIHNPSANAFLGGGIAPLQQLRTVGVPVCLATDAAGANSRQSLFEEMRMSALLAKATAQDASVITATDSLRLGTTAGGLALRMPVGRLAAGFKADIVSLDLTALSLRPRRTATQNIVYSMLPEAIDRVLVGGREVVRRGQVLTIDAVRVAEEVDALTGSWSPLTGTHPPMRPGHRL